MRYHRKHRKECNMKASKRISKRLFALLGVLLALVVGLSSCDLLPLTDSGAKATEAKGTSRPPQKTAQSPQGETTKGSAEANPATPSESLKEWETPNGGPQRPSEKPDDPEEPTKKPEEPTEKPDIPEPPVTPGTQPPTTPEVPATPEVPTTAPEVPTTAPSETDTDAPSVCAHENTEPISGTAATCSATGLTEGLKCSDCGEILTAQTEIPKLQHRTEDDETCALCGKTRAVILEEELKCDTVSITEYYFSGHRADNIYAVKGISNYPFSKLELPEKHNEKNILAIAEKAFENCTQLKEITLSSRIVSIEVFAFQGCTNLSKVSLPTDIKQICGSAFNNCTALSDILLPNALVYIGDYAFEGAGLTEIRIPATVTMIRTGILKNCKKLTQIYLDTNNDTLTRQIWDEAFMGCSALQTVDIPDQFSQLGKSVFRDCTSLEQVTLSSKIQNVGNRAFMGCTSLARVDFTAESVWISDEAFKNCTSLKFFLPNTVVTSIGVEAFSGCTALFNVVFQDGLQKIGNNAFENCSSLSLITLPDSVTTFGVGVFLQCEALEQIHLPKNLKAIPSSTFSGCSLKKISIPEGVEEIGARAFNWCPLTDGVYLPKTLKKIVKDAFAFHDTNITIKFSGSESDWNAITKETGCFGNNVTVTVVYNSEYPENT